MAEQNLSSSIRPVADLLRGNFRQSEYGKVILSLSVLRRPDCVLEPTKAAVLKELAKRQDSGVNPEPFLFHATKVGLFFNPSPRNPRTSTGDQYRSGEGPRAKIKNSLFGVRILELMSGARQ